MWLWLQHCFVSTIENFNCHLPTIAVSQEISSVIKLELFLTVSASSHELSYARFSDTQWERERDRLQGFICICLRRGLWPKGIFSKSLSVLNRTGCLLTFLLRTRCIVEAENDLASRVLLPFLSQLVRITLKSLFTRSPRDTCIKKNKKKTHKPLQYYHISDSVNVQTFLQSLCLSCGFYSLLVFLPLVKPSCVSLILTEWKETMFNANVIYIRVMDAKYTI